MGDTGFMPANELLRAGGECAVAAAFTFVLSVSGFLPSFQKSLFLGFAAVSSTMDSDVRVDDAGGSCSKGAAESLDSVLGALIRSLTVGSLDDMLAIRGEQNRVAAGLI